MSSITRLRLELEIDTQSHSMRVIDQKVSDGMPTTQVAMWPICAIDGCDKPTAKLTGKYCSQAHFGLGRHQEAQRIGPVARTRKKRTVVAVVPVAPQRQLEVAQMNGTGNYKEFTFPQL